MLLKCLSQLENLFDCAIAAITNDDRIGVSWVICLLQPNDDYDYDAAWTGKMIKSSAFLLRLVACWASGHYDGNYKDENDEEEKEEEEEVENGDCKDDDGILSAMSYHNLKVLKSLFV